MDGQVFSHRQIWLSWLGAANRLGVAIGGGYDETGFELILRVGSGLSLAEATVQSDGIAVLGSECAAALVPASTRFVEAGSFGGRVVPRAVCFESGSEVDQIVGAAFRGCTGLKRLKLPPGLEAIVNWADGESCVPSLAFEGCVALRTVEFPEGLSMIGDYAFGGCVGLMCVTFPKRLLIIGCNAFKGCVQLSAVQLPEEIASLAAGSFDGCKSLRAVGFPPRCQGIGRSAFSACVSLGALAFPAGLRAIDDFAFARCEGLTSVQFPADLLAIGYRSFDGCTGLKRVSVPRGANVHPGAFPAGCAVEQV